MGITIDAELNDCRAMSDQWHQRFDTKSGPHFRPLLGIGKERAEETYPGLTSLPLPHGHHEWFAFREDGAESMTLYFCPPPLIATFRCDDRRVWRFFDQLFREGGGYLPLPAEKQAAEDEQRDHDQAVEDAFARR